MIRALKVERRSKNILATIIVGIQIGVDLYLIDKIQQGEKQWARGAGVPHETAKQRLSKWLQ